MAWLGRKTEMVQADRALPGRAQALPVPERHAVLGTPLRPPFPDDTATALLALGCFWGAERDFWQQPGVFTTATGYSGGFTPNPTYEEVCTGQTGHAETVMVVYRPAQITYEALLRVFSESHDPTQGMRQGADVGTQYRSAIFYASEREHELALASARAYGERLRAAGFGAITTEIVPADKFYYAEDYHQQYLEKNPDGYCGVGGTGVSCPIGVLKA